MKKRNIMKIYEERNKVMNKCSNEKNNEYKWIWTISWKVEKKSKWW